MTSLTLLLAALVSMLLHEAAHGIAADLLGDGTPRLVGRATWNPLAHVDPILTGVVPIALWLLTAGRFAIGAARPMPVTWRRLDRKAQLIVILAGVWMNAALGLLAGGYGNAWCQSFAQLQAWLVILNLLPVPPLDGWRLVQWTRRAL